MNTDNILVFATNIKTKQNKKQISNVLNENKEIINWNIDQEDIDCVLRIVSNKLTIDKVIETITLHNFECKELQ